MFFANKGVEYTERDISTDEQAKSELTNLGIMSVPVIRAKGELIVGFQRSRLEQLVTNLSL